MASFDYDADLDAVLRRIRDDVAPHIGSGKVADYIPALARVDPHRFGMAVTALDGTSAATADAAEPFSLQSISKIFTLTLALDVAGQDLWRRVGREPSGNPFNSLVQLEHESGIPRNPLINAGALVVTDILVSRHGVDGAIAAIVDFVRSLTGNPNVSVDMEVMESERAWGHRNVALANFMKSFGNLDNRPHDVLEVYFHQCAIALCCNDLSRAVTYLAAGGRDPLSGRTIVSPERARRLNALMLTCGHYDASGEFAFRVGLPAKSGVGGGIAAVVPGALGVAVWSPGLNEQGNSLVGTLALERFSQLAGHSVF
jgi:glutaminase